MSSYAGYATQYRRYQPGVGATTPGALSAFALRQASKPPTVHAPRLAGMLTGSTAPKPMSQFTVPNVGPWGPGTGGAGGNLPGSGPWPPGAPPVAGVSSTPGTSTSQTPAWQNDPTYLAAVAAINQGEQGAASGYLGGLENLLLGFGSRELAHSILDPIVGNAQFRGYLGTNPNLNAFYNSLTPEAQITENTAGWLGNALHQYKQGLRTERSNNIMNNLYYGSARLAQEGEMNRNRLQNEATMRQSLAQQFAGLGNAYNQQIADYLFKKAQAAQTASQNPNNQGGGGGGGGGGASKVTGWGPKVYQQALKDARAGRRYNSLGLMLTK